LDYAQNLRERKFEHILAVICHLRETGVTAKFKVILVHGNGAGTARDHWFPYVERELQSHGIMVDCRDFPDSELAREKYWIPFLRDEIRADQNSIIVGHSSGAVAAMRYAETDSLCGSVLVSACYTDLGMETEKLSGYYDRPWPWEQIRTNQSWIVQFASADDPFIPIDEARFINRKLQTEYFESNGDGHFRSEDGRSEFPELVEVIIKKLGNRGDR